MNNNPKIVWGIIVAHPNLVNWGTSKPSVGEVGEWCSGPDHDEKSPSGHMLFHTRQKAEAEVKKWNCLSWTYAAKKYPLHRKS